MKKKGYSYMDMGEKGGFHRESTQRGGRGNNLKRRREERAASKKG